jgi:hypothetical protein
MHALDHRCMSDQTENETTEEADAVDPYGDVALGVECAWPQSIPVAQATPSDLPS